MRKLMLSVCVFMLTSGVAVLGSSCSDNYLEDNMPQQEMFSPDIKKSIDLCYKAACDYLNCTYVSTATDEQKIAVIRRADAKDEAGDVLPEMCEYDDIASILWPMGYCNYDFLN